MKRMIKKVTEEEIYAIASRGLAVPDGSYYAEINPISPHYKCVRVNKGRIYNNIWNHKKLAMKWLE